MRKGLTGPFSYSENRLESGGNQVICLYGVLPEDKEKLLICFAVIALLITGGGKKPAAPPLELPDDGQITAVEVTTIDGFSCSCSDRGWIGQFVSVISSAQATDELSVQEHPASDYYGEFSISDGDKAIETIYYYLKGNRGYVEKTYQGIYEIDMEELKSLIQDMN